MLLATFITLNDTTALSMRIATMRQDKYTRNRVATMRKLHEPRERSCHSQVQALGEKLQKTQSLWILELYASGPDDGVDGGHILMHRHGRSDARLPISGGKRNNEQVMKLQRITHLGSAFSSVCSIYDTSNLRT